MPLHVAFVCEALATELAGVPRLATVHSLLMSSELHLAVEHLATQCTPPIYLMELVVLGLLGRIQFCRDLGLNSTFKSFFFLLRYICFHFRD